MVCESGPVAYFSLELSAEVRSLLGEQHKQQIIFECETLAAVIAFILWSKFFASKRCVLYVDNEGSKFALIKGFADNDVVDKLAHLLLQWKLMYFLFFGLQEWLRIATSLTSPPVETPVSLTIDV